MDSESRLLSQAIASGGTGLSDELPGNHFCMTAPAASLRAFDGGIEFTSSAAPAKSTFAAPCTRAAAALANVVPVRFASHHFRAPGASYLAHPSTKAGLRRFLAAASAFASQPAASLRSRSVQLFKTALAKAEAN